MRLADMSAETEPAGAARAPGRWLRRIDIPVREADDQPPSAARPRFAWNMGEVSGAFGDLGTFLPHIVGAITVVKMDPTGILTTFGLFYAFTGAFYGVPMAVQPMKAASAAVLIEPMAPAAIAGAGLVIGAFLLVLGLTGVVSRLARALPGSIAAGLQLGLGLSLAALGIRLIGTQIWLGVVISALMLGLMRYQRSPVALVAVLVGIAVGQVLGITPPFLMPDLGLHLPRIVVPTWAQIIHGTEYAVLPQIPLTLTNAIIVTAAVSRQLFPREQHPVNERNLAITTGLGNLLSAPFGGYLMCHGAGGIAGHFRFGGRTATAPVLDRADLRCARDRLRRERLCDAQDDPGRGVGRAAAVLGDRARPVREAARAPGRRVVPRPPDGRYRRRPQPGSGLRGRSPYCVRIQARMAARLTHTFIRRPSLCAVEGRLWGEAV
jgi:SulP family sulfate permease